MWRSEEAGDERAEMRAWINRGRGRERVSREKEIILIYLL